MVALTAPRALVAATHAGRVSLVPIDAAGHKLRADAAASVERMRAAGCPRGNVTSAYRTAAEQTREVARDAAGLTSAAALGTSWHEAGLAVDWPEPARSWVRAHGAAHGWVFTLASEPWHAVYVPTNDQHATEEDDMPTIDEIRAAVADEVAKILRGDEATAQRVRDAGAGVWGAQGARGGIGPARMDDWLMDTRGAVGELLTAVRAGSPAGGAIDVQALAQAIADRLPGYDVTITPKGA